MIQNHRFSMVVLAWLTGLLQQRKKRKYKFPKLKPPGIAMSYINNNYHQEKWQVIFLRCTITIHFFRGAM